MRRHGLSGWDPQSNEPIGEQPAPATASRPTGIDQQWTEQRLSGLIGSKHLRRAWSLADLPERVSFGEAVGVFLVAMALRDGMRVDQVAARRAISSVVADCARGIPTRKIWIEIDQSIIDVTGYAAVVARGQW